MRHLFLLLLICSAPVTSEEPELLDPAQAFRFSARVLSDSVIEVIYRIAPDYYLYREKFKFSGDPQMAQLGSPDIPPGKIKQDEFFGRVEIYRDEVRIRIPVRRFENLPADLNLTAIAQGCADIGVCFPPFAQTARLRLVAADIAPP